MEYIEARDLIRDLDAALVRDLDKLALGQDAARKRYCQAIKPVLAGLLGREPTKQEVLLASMEHGYETAVGMEEE